MRACPASKLRRQQRRAAIVRRIAVARRHQAARFRINGRQSRRITSPCLNPPVRADYDAIEASRRHIIEKQPS
jgi:hypothetical protein